MTQYAGRGDARRSLALLWGRVERGSRGPKGSLDVEEIARVAISVADEEGLEATSMRRVAEAFGRSPMTLYTYVPSKAELVDLMLDRSLAELALDPPDGNGWRCAAEAAARRMFDFYQRHPWVLQISTARPMLGPNETALLEAQARLFDGLGLSGVDMVRLAAILGGFVRWSATALTDSAEVARVTGIDDQLFWQERVEILAEVSREDWETRYPTLLRLQLEEGTFDQPWEGQRSGSYAENVALDVFELGLRCTLDGIESHIARVRGGE